jgi:hypothetical protein
MRYINPTQIKDTPKETVTLNHEDVEFVLQMADELRPWERLE